MRIGFLRIGIQFLVEKAGLDIPVIVVLVARVLLVLARQLVIEDLANRHSRVDPDGLHGEHRQCPEAAESDIAKSGGKLDSSTLSIDSDRQWGLEGLYISGPLSLQSEFFVKNTSGADGGPGANVRHYYAQATYSLTGERRGYKAKSGVADIIKPISDGLAIELVCKLDHIEFDMGCTSTEAVSGYLAGLNLYPNRNLKLMLNLIRVNSNNIAAEADDDAATVISIRLQLAL